MKTAILGLLMVGLFFSAQAASRPKLDDRIQSLTTKFTDMQQNSATRVPAAELARARGIILLDRTKGAFFVGFHGGNGVALVRNKMGQWSPAGFVTSVGGSLGPQIGGSKDFFVILLMSPNAVETLKQPVMNFGAQASATGGTQHTGGSVNFESMPPVMVYSERNGLYAGASLKVGSIKADKDANNTYYGQPVSMDGILFGHEVQPSRAEARLIGKIDEFSR